MAKGKQGVPPVVIGIVAAVVVAGVVVFVFFNPFSTPAGQTEQLYESMPIQELFGKRNATLGEARMHMALGASREQAQAQVAKDVAFYDEIIRARGFDPERPLEEQLAERGTESGG